MTFTTPEIIGGLVLDRRGIPDAYGAFKLADKIIHGDLVLLGVPQITLRDLLVIDGTVITEGCTRPILSNVRVENARKTALLIAGGAPVVDSTCSFRVRQVGMDADGPPVIITGPIPGGRFDARVAGAGPLFRHPVLQAVPLGGGYLAMQIGPHPFDIGATVVLRSSAGPSVQRAVINTNMPGGIIHVVAPPWDMTGGMVTSLWCSVLVHNGGGAVNEMGWVLPIIEGLTADHQGNLYPDKAEGSVGVLFCADYGQGSIYKHTLVAPILDAGYDNMMMTAPNSVHGHLVQNIKIIGAQTGAPRDGIVVEGGVGVVDIDAMHTGHGTGTAGGSGAPINPDFATNSSAVNVRARGAIAPALVRVDGHLRVPRGGDAVNNVHIPAYAVRGPARLDPDAFV